jgi:hypothetical protein
MTPRGGIYGDRFGDGSPVSVDIGAPLGSYRNPVKLTGPIPEEYPAEFKDRSYIYVQETDGEITKVYRSYADACD